MEVEVYCMIELTREMQKQAGLHSFTTKFCYADSGPNRTLECLHHRRSTPSNGGECQFHPALQQLPAVMESLEQFGLQETVKSYGEWVWFSVCNIAAVRDEIALMQAIEKHIERCGKSHENWVFFERVKQEVPA